MLMIFSYLFLLISNSFAMEWKTIDALINQSMKSRIFPGGILVVGQNDKILHENFYGEGPLGSNSKDTLYDIASLTKVVGTATSILILEERGLLSLDDRLGKFFPEFSAGLKDSVTLENLLKHEAGFPSGKSPLVGESYTDYIKRVLISPLSYAPGTKTLYSDLSFILLGEVVKKVSGLSLSAFTKSQIFTPLGMDSTFYHVPLESTYICARTFSDRQALPHDPTAYNFYPEELGHAGIFTTGSDLSRLVRMYAGMGEVDGVRILKTETIKKMTLLKKGELRGLGWDFLSEYATAPRGEVFPRGLSYGHTGYTGTTIWIDPQSKSYYLFLSNRVLSGDSSTKKKFSEFRKKLATGIGKKIYSR